MRIWSWISSVLPFISEKPEIVKDGDVYRADWRDYTWYIPYKDIRQARWCKYFIDSHERYLDYLTESDTILEVGAATGEYTVEAARRLSSKGHIYAFEAEPQNYKCMEKNLDIHEVLDVSTAINLAMSDGSEKEISFQVADSIAEHKVKEKDVDYADKKYFSDEGDNADNEVGIITISATTIDEYCAENDIEELDLLKLTVNGHEGSILSGAKRMLSNTEAVFMNDNYDDAEQILTDHGFKRKFDGEHDALGNPQLWVSVS